MKNEEKRKKVVFGRDENDDRRRKMESCIWQIWRLKKEK